MSQQDKLEQSTVYLQQQFKHFNIFPKLAVILGSGLGDFAQAVETKFEMAYKDIPGFPVTSVEGHTGSLVVGNLDGKAVLIFKGRIHVYEGYTAQEAAFTSYLLKQLNINMLISTNAVGGMRPELYLGALVLIEDHINFSFHNPLTHTSLDMKNAYNMEWQNIARMVAKQEGLKLHSGIYGGISGPSYLSVAELKMLRRLGADIVGMSTIPEVIVARLSDIKVLGISCVTDMVVPEALEPLDHDMVVRVANQTRPKFTQLLRAIANQLFISEEIQ